MKKFDFCVLITLVAIAAPFLQTVQAVEDEKPADSTNGDDKLVNENKENLVQKKIERFENIIKSPRDTREYRGLKLGNELSVLLISDPDADRAAACMTVAVGSMHDFDELPGLAHFLEHMLFMGSEKYRAENHFVKFIQEHAGSYNGTTGEASQDYFWDVADDQLEEALDIFAQFFLNPLMDPSCVDREINAVESEFSMNQTKDGWRIRHLLCSLSKPGHAHGRFGSGNLKSLKLDSQEKGINVREKLLELYSARYSSNLMYLAVLGKETLDELEKMIVPRFEGITNRKLERSVFSEHPWGPEQLKRRVRVLTIADVRILFVRFPMPAYRQHYKAAPLQYINMLIGHEGPGSLAGELKRRNWCEALSCGTSLVPGFSFFYIEINLTEEAMDHIDDMVKLIFQYIYLLKNVEPEERIFEEMKKIKLTTFENEAKSSPASLVNYASSSMMNYPFEDVLTPGVLIDDWNPSLIKYFLDFLRPDNMNILICSKSFEEIEGKTQTEPWYGTKYNIDEISDDFIDKEWKITEFYDKFHLPSPNEFITRDFRIYPLGPNESNEPRIIHESPISQFWFKQDEKFKLPRMNIRFNIYSPITCLNHENESLISIFASLFVDKYLTYGYSAVLAGLSWEVNTIRCGIEVDLYGYHKKLPNLLQNLLSEMLNFQVDAQKFEIRKESSIRGLKNFATIQPHMHSKFYLSHLLYYSVYPKHEFLEGVKRVKAEELSKLVKHLFSRVFIQGFIYGNCDEQLARHVIGIVEEAFNSASVVLPQEVTFVRGVELDEGSSFTYTSTHKHSTSSSYVGYFQVDADYPLVNVALTALFDEVVSEKCFQVLRTEEQLGYIVGCGLGRSSGVVSFKMTVQSEEHPVYLDSRVEVFLNALRETLEDTTVEEMEKYKTSLINIYMEKILTQGAMANYYWGEITDRRYLFNKQEHMAGIVKSLGKKDVLDFFEKYISASSTQRRKLASYVVSEVTNPKLAEDVQLENEKIDDVLAFKNRSGLFPLPVATIEIDPVGTKV